MSVTTVPMIVAGQHLGVVVLAAAIALLIAIECTPTQSQPKERLK